MGKETDKKDKRARKIIEELLEYHWITKCRLDGCDGSVWHEEDTNLELREIWIEKTIEKLKHLYLSSDG